MKKVIVFEELVLDMVVTILMKKGGASPVAERHEGKVAKISADMLSLKKAGGVEIDLIKADIDKVEAEVAPDEVSDLRAQLAAVEKKLREKEAEFAEYRGTVMADFEASCKVKAEAAEKEAEIEALKAQIASLKAEVVELKTKLAAAEEAQQTLQMRVAEETRRVTQAEGARQAAEAARRDAETALRDARRGSGGGNGGTRPSSRDLEHHDDVDEFAEGSRRLRWIRIGVAVFILLLIGFLVWNLSGSTDDVPTSTPPTPPVRVTPPPPPPAFDKDAAVRECVSHGGEWSKCFLDVEAWVVR